MIKGCRRLVSLISCCSIMESIDAKGDNEFPKTLGEFGYGFNEKGQMRKLGEKGKFTDEGFQFEVRSGDRSYNQRHYEALGEVITEVVYDFLETKGNLKRIKCDDSFIFGSDQFEEKEKLVVLIHGSGVVRAGQWTRKLIMNEDLTKGTMLPFIQYFLDDSWGVLVMNTNHNVDETTGEKIPGHESPENHARTVWSSRISTSKAESIVVIAHSYGGVVVMDLASRFKEDFLDRVDKVLMTDSVHYGLAGDDKVNSKLKKISINYVASDEDLGTPIVDKYSRREDLKLVSAGDGRHEWTSWSAMEHIFKEVGGLNNDLKGKENLNKNDDQTEKSNLSDKSQHEL